MKRYLPDGFTAHSAARAPSLAWNRDDALQDMLVRKVFRRNITRPV
jgi:LysR family transcriptional regulator, chromosome initiation inhibitor